MISEQFDKSAQQKSPEITSSPTWSVFHEDHCFTMPAVGEPVLENQDVLRFPEKLFALLDRAEAEGFDHIISWQPHGRCFLVQDRETFKVLLSALMPGMTRWKSFQRQLNQWGFTRLTKGRDTDGMYHELFLRYRPHLLRHMRWGSSSNRSTGRENAGTLPDFYAMTFLTPLESNNVSTGNEVVFSTSLCPSPNTSDPIGGSASMSDHSDKVGVNLLNHSINSSIDDSRASLAAIDEMEGERAEQSVPRRRRRHCFGVQARDSLAQNAVSHPDSRMCQEEERTSAGFQEIDLDGELEPRPLPPVIIRGGETLFPSYLPIPVSHHPGFVRIGPQEFLYEGHGVDGSELEALAGIRGLSKMPDKDVI
jgi:HSF-type DNA-binding